MVSEPIYLPGSTSGLSVLALSSRFDGPVVPPPAPPLGGLSVLALSSRFDGLVPERK